MGDCKFSGGIEKANLILSAGILQKSWHCISALHQSPHLPFFVQELPKVTIMAFRAVETQLGQDAPEPTLQRLDKNDPTFGFLTTKRIPSVSIHSSPLSVFLSLLRSTDLEKQLKELTAKGKPRLILVGESLGGAVAALCTLWLLKGGPLLLPVCVTFGSPLLGDVKLEKAIRNIEPWKTHFWHVVDLGDPIPRRFPSDSFWPFGTYFLLSGSTCTCFDDPNAIAKLLRSGYTATNFVDYGRTMQPLLDGKSKYRRGLPLIDHFQDSLRAGLILQLAVAGIFQPDLQSELLQALETNENVVYSKTKNAQLISSKRLNDVKKRMAQLEWYKKTCEDSGIVYYDSYKKRADQKDFDMHTCSDLLSNYWKQKVEEAESKPQAPDARMRTRWLFSGVTYMRMVEPLAIAEHYRKRQRKDYLSERDEHYKVLDKWNDEEAAKKKETAKKEKAPSLTEDSCFWAHVEEAQLKLGKLRDGSDREHELKEQLIEFETYIMKLVDNYELSPEVFLPNSLFMDWWRQYEKLPEEKQSLNAADTSPFVCFMKAENYKNYK